MHNLEENLSWLSSDAATQRLHTTAEQLKSRTTNEPSHFRHLFSCRLLNTHPPMLVDFVPERQPITNGRRIPPELPGWMARAVRGAMIWSVLYYEAMTCLCLLRNEETAAWVELYVLTDIDVASELIDLARLEGVVFSAAEFMEL